MEDPCYFSRADRAILDKAACLRRRPHHSKADKVILYRAKRIKRAVAAYIALRKDVQWALHHIKETEGYFRMHAHSGKDAILKQLRFLRTRYIVANEKATIIHHKLTTNGISVTEAAAELEKHVMPHSTFAKQLKSFR